MASSPLRRDVSLLLLLLSTFVPTTSSLSPSSVLPSAADSVGKERSKRDIPRRRLRRCSIPLIATQIVNGVLERLLNEMQIQLENLVWENKELEERLQIAMEDRKVIEMILKEIEEEHEKAVTRIDLLENEELKEENMRSNEVQGKTLWGSKSHYEKDVRSGESILIDTDYGSTSMHPSYNRRGLSLSDPEEPHEKGEALRQQRVVVLSRSLFSAFLSLLVGMIIWEAEDPCVPLVAALFTVVGISLGSVLEFFSAIRNRPASDAVALLSINWFILGTLSSRTLPVIAHMLAPSAIRIAVQLVGWLVVGSVATPNSQHPTVVRVGRRAIKFHDHKNDITTSSDRRHHPTGRRPPGEKVLVVYA
ncbi:2OG-Fe(II) oxygenase superfamily [Musa troglodytarum]|uniref:2OG-Fe(II) oxygenase superfamily n=1 Tax=Musa troglodytarum TaxID=320322 RepID=A0A9E7KHS7_9LILI|nr:2OG-Fe(II) oxygenase superfamily [Musa troglodytarum]